MAQKLIGFKVTKPVPSEHAPVTTEEPRPRDSHGRFVGVHQKIVQNPKWDFVLSPRFWAMVGLAITVGLQQDGLIHGGLATALLTVFGGFFGVKSYEKYITPKK